MRHQKGKQKECSDHDKSDGSILFRRYKLLRFSLSFVPNTTGTEHRLSNCTPDCLVADHFQESHFTPLSSPFSQFYCFCIFEKKKVGKNKTKQKKSRGVVLSCIKPPSPHKGATCMSSLENEPHQAVPPPLFAYMCLKWKNRAPRR